MCVAPLSLLGVPAGLVWLVGDLLHPVDVPAVERLQSLPTFAQGVDNKIAEPGGVEKTGKSG
jgi:hypothetical protein